MSESLGYYIKFIKSKCDVTFKHREIKMDNYDNFLKSFSSQLEYDCSDFHENESKPIRFFIYFECS